MTAVPPPLQESSVNPALHAMHQKSATSSARFVQALARLAGRRTDVAGTDETMGRTICAAVEARRASLEVGYAALELRHPLLTRSMADDGDSDALLRRLADEAESASARVQASDGAMPKSDELPKILEEVWREHARARDQARQEQAHFSELRLEGLSAKQRCLERALRGVREGAIELPELPMSDTLQDCAESRASGGRASSLLAACADLEKCVHELEQACAEVRAQVATITTRIGEEQSVRRKQLQADLQAGAAELRAARHVIDAPVALHGRRVRAEALLASMETLQVQYGYE